MCLETIIMTNNPTNGLNKSKKKISAYLLVRYTEIFTDKIDGIFLPSCLGLWGNVGYNAGV